MTDNTAVNDNGKFENFAPAEESVETELTTRKYLAFVSDELSYAIDVDFVNEIIMTNSITRLPKLPPYISGIINLRGQIVPIMDIRLRMGREKTVFTDDTCIIVMNIYGVQLGILVDSVSQMIDIPEAGISQLPMSRHQELVNGIIRVGQTVYLIISIEEIMKKKD